MGKDNLYSSQLIQQAKNPNPSQEFKIDDFTTVRVFGEWDAEKLIERLLESDSITG